MAVNLSLTEALQAVQKMMGDVVTVNDPGNYKKLIGTLEWLFSPFNGSTINIQQGQSALNGKYRPCEIRFTPQKGTGDLVTSDALANCNKVTHRREQIQTLNPALFVHDKFSIDEELVREGTPLELQAVLTREIRDAQRICREDADRQLLAAYNTAIGSNPGSGVGVGQNTSLQLLLSDGTVDPATFDDILIHKEDNFMVGVPGVIGLGNMRKYNNLLAVGNVRDSGVDIREIANNFGLIHFKDQNTLSALGDIDDVIVSYPGLSQFFQYNFYRNSDFALETPDSSKKSTIPDAVFGSALMWDFIFKYDDECSTTNGIQGSYTGRIFTYFDLWTPPQAAFGEPYADLGDFTGTVGYNITKAA